jgi:threonine dehydrogenase-like Zn-dependent dehydrogenase
MQGASLVIGIDKSPVKNRMAREFGVDAFVCTEGDGPVPQILELTGGYGVSTAFECVGTPGTYLSALHAVKPGGCVVLIGVCMEPVRIQPFPLLMKEVRILFAANHTREEQCQVIEMVRNGSLDLSKSITHRLPLSRIQEGFDLLQEGRGEVGAIVVLNAGDSGAESDPALCR